MTSPRAVAVIFIFEATQEGKAADPGVVELKRDPDGAYAMLSAAN